MLFLSPHREQTKRGDAYGNASNSDPESCRQRTDTHLDPKVVEKLIGRIGKVAERLAVFEDLIARICNGIGDDLPLTLAKKCSFLIVASMLTF